MNTIHRIATGTVAALAILAAYVLTTATATATRPPVNVGDGYSRPDGGTGGTGGVTTTIVNNGSTWWTFVLVAAAGVAFATGIAMLLSRLRHRRSTRLAVSG